MYLNRFTLPIDLEINLLKERAAYNGGRYGYIDNPYPCLIFSEKQFDEMTFDKITIFYGGNGSGKSTLLNLIAEKLNLRRIAPFNSGEMFESYVENCQYETGCDEEGFCNRIPVGSSIITSDDIFDYMLTVRTASDEIGENKQIAREKWTDLKYGENIRFGSLKDYEAFHMQVMSRRKSVSRRQFIRNTAGNELELYSNGETALQYFNARLKNDTLYCLDEPENSLSPKMQLELVKKLEEKAYYCGCQFIIATHSPFLLALDGAKIYDLDSSPVDIKNWWELENTQIYYEFFKKHEKLFKKFI